MAQLSVNMNVAALLRNRRGHPWPDVVGLARAALEAGAVGLTLHPRPDERHAMPGDVRAFRNLIDDAFPDRELNIEGYPDERFLALVEEVGAEQVTLVPDAPDQATSDHGWAFERDVDFLSKTIERLRSAAGRIVLFADPDAAQMQHAAATGADRVEFYTGLYGAAHSNDAEQERQLRRLGEAAQAAHGYGLGVNAGHDLTVPGTRKLVARVPEISEVSIGHALFCDAVHYGIRETVERYLSACRPEPEGVGS